MNLNTRFSLMLIKPLHSLMALALVALLLVQSAQSLLPLVQWSLQNDAQRLDQCVNVNKPQLHCCGRCHRDNQIRQVVESLDQGAQIHSPSTHLLGADLLASNQDLLVLNDSSVALEPSVISLWPGRSPQTLDPPPRS